MLKAWLLVSCFILPLSVLPRTEVANLRRTLPSLQPDEISLLVSSPNPLKNVDLSNPKSHLSKILIPRVVETENHTLVRNYIVETLKVLNWEVELDAFISETPFGRRTFTNIIATKDPSASRRVVLSAHYDSKYFPKYPENQFVGATDSAVPCAIILDLAETLNPHLDNRKKMQEQNDDDVDDLTLQLVFFDGEEAFIDWTDKDSIYGARHLAEQWDSTYVFPIGKRKLMDYATTKLATIEHLILLDLLGAPQPSVRSYFLDTAWLFDAIVSVERRLGELGAFAYGDERGMAPGQWSSYFRPRSLNSMNIGYIGDDHVPFLRKGVSILHIIAEPFPQVWHTLKDDASALDLPTMRRWNLILRVFMSEYLQLFASSTATSPPSGVKRSSEDLRLPKLP